MRTLTSAAIVCFLTLAGAGAADDKAIKKEIDLLRGTWSVNVTMLGQEVKYKFAIYGDESFEINLGGVQLNGSRKIDPSKKPKEITLSPDGSDKPLLGIYKVEGDTLTIRFGEKRPTDFKAKDGPTLWVMKREKRTDK
jgi:uncharacterized protein (TIGR03067 family)